MAPRPFRPRLPPDLDARELTRAQSLTHLDVVKKLHDVFNNNDHDHLEAMLEYVSEDVYVKYVAHGGVEVWVFSPHSHHRGG